MDIRNFFGPRKGKPTPATKSKSTSSTTSKTQAKKEPKTTQKLTTTSSLSSKAEAIPKTTTLSNKKRSRVLMETDSDTAASNNGIEMVEISKNSNTKSNNESNNIPKRVDISAQDFFVENDSSKKQKNNAGNPITRKEKKTMQIENVEDSSHTDSEEEYQPNKDDDDVNMDNESEEDLLIVEEPPKKQTKPSSPKRKPPPPKKTTPKKSAITKVLLVPQPPYPKPFTTDQAPSGCLNDITFVITGIFSNQSREDMEDFLKILGGRVTKAVSGKTNYLICGNELEDGRPVQDGSKYKKALELGDSKIRILMGEEQMYGIVKTICESRGGAINLTNKQTNEKDDLNSTFIKEPKETISSTKTPIGNPYAKKTIANPYAKKTITNPYAKKPMTNPYAKNKSSSSTSTVSTQSKPTNKHMGGRADINDSHALWADKYAPSSINDILGNKESVRKLTMWLNRWENTNNTSQRRGPPQKAALLSGPPGIGKTTTAVLVSEASGREVLEWNASDVRSKKGLEAGLGDVMGSRVLSFDNTKSKKEKKRCIIMDEVDGMGAGDRSGMAELIKVIKNTKVPVICICNDRQSQKVRTLVNYCLDLRFRRPVKSVIARRAIEIGQMENMTIELNAAESIAESCGNDIRQVLNCIQMWSMKKKQGDRSDMTYKDLKERQRDINKDESLRVNIFDSTRLVVEGPRGLGHEDVTREVANKSLYERCDAYFTDYNLMGLNVHQNYLKVMISQFQETKRADDPDAEASVLDRMEKATLSMSDYGVSEHRVMSGDQLWQLLPLCSVLTVKAGSHASGSNGSFLPGYPEFAGWLGKNSSRGKKKRLLQELNHHMNYTISADKTALRLYYLPILREQFLSLMKHKEGSMVNETIDLMDEYGLDRDDLFENMDEFNLDSKSFKFASLDSKAKAAFTREYNKRAHKSQALVEEQSSGKAGKKKKASQDDDYENDGNASNDDEEDDPEEIKKLFQKKGKAKAKKSKAKAGSKRKKK